MSYPLRLHDRYRVAVVACVSAPTIEKYFRAERPLASTTRARVEQALRECGFAHLITPPSPPAGDNGR